MPSWAINSTNLSNYIKLNKMEETSKNNETAQLGIGGVMQLTLLILKNWKGYKYWKAKKNGKKFNEFNRGAGYYITLGILGHNPIGQKWEAQMQSGKVGLYELVDYETYRDPYDMVKNSYWNFIGYKGIKPIHECNFEEFLSLYAA